MEPTPELFEVTRRQSSLQHAFFEPNEGNHNDVMLNLQDAAHQFRSVVSEIHRRKHRGGGKIHTSQYCIGLPERYQRMGDVLEPIEECVKRMKKIATPAPMPFMRWLDTLDLGDFRWTNRDGAWTTLATCGEMIFKLRAKSATPTPTEEGFAKMPPEANEKFLRGGDPVKLAELSRRVAEFVACDTSRGCWVALRAIQELAGELVVLGDDEEADPLTCARVIKDHGVGYVKEWCHQLLSYVGRNETYMETLASLAPALLVVAQALLAKVKLDSSAGEMVALQRFVLDDTPNA